MSKEQKISHWEIIAHPGETVTYSWRSIGPAGVIDSSSEIDNYGKAIVDAIKHGFRPEQDHWIKISKSYAVHFAPNQAPVIVPTDGSTAKSRQAGLAGKRAAEKDRPVETAKGRGKPDR